jgi:hypothetical protein
MTPRELLESYAIDTDFERGDLSDDREHEAPKAFAALRTVLDRHSEFKIYDECGHHHRYSAEGVVTDGVVAVENVGLTCEDGYEYSICRECCTASSQEYQTEGCASAHDHNGCWPCTTVEDITKALEAP